MRWLHLGDLHLGKSLGEYDLYDDQKYMLDEILEIADKEGVDGFLIAGDVYDKSVPSEAATKLLNHFMNEIAIRDLKVCMISGNHDSDERLNYGSSLFATKQIYISSLFDGVLHKQSFCDGECKVDVYLLPFVKASQVKHFFPDERIESYEDAVRVILQNTVLDKSSTNILVAHQFVASRGMDPELGGSEGLATQMVGTVEKIGYDLFDDFDYVALGHIHSPQRVGRDEVRYSGSMLKYSLKEVHDEKSVPLITISGDEKLKIELVPLKPMRDVRRVKGTLKELMSDANASEDFIYATVTDEDDVTDVMGILRQVYQNIVDVNYDNSHTRGIEQGSADVNAADRSYTEIVSEFYSYIYGCDISDEEMAVMKEVGKEVGIIYEAD